MKRIVKLLLKTAGILVVLGSVGFGILYMVYNEPLPEGKSGPEADALAHKMLRAVNNEAYQNTRFLEWSFAGGAHQYKWDKANGKVEVEWDDYSVTLILWDSSISTIYKDGVLVAPEQNRDITSKALDYFNNDSFWLVAPFKVMDKGVKRSIVTLEDGSDGLLVSYTQGGSTPGDSYLWHLNENGFPESYQMWVKIIPIGGIRASWDDWQITESGAFLPTSHKIGPVTLFMKNVKAYN
jgi:hypothetical protein